MFAGMLERDRKRCGFRVCQVAWHLGVSVRQYRELEAGTRLPTFETWDRMCKLYGWSQSFVGGGEPPPARARAVRRDLRSHARA
jgi:hypothetical protein